MTPLQAGALMRRARKLLRAGELTHCQYVLLDCMVWPCRRPGADRVCVSYSALQRLAHQARDTVARGVARLRHLGLIERVRRRVRVMGASRQATNIYVLRTESDQRPVYGQQEKKQPAVEQALAGLLAAISGRPGAARAAAGAGET